MSGDDAVEIERKWLLDGLPDRIRAFETGEPDSSIRRLRMRQGYLRPATEAEIDRLAGDPTDVGPIRFGRIRSIESAGGVSFVHTVKSGQGLVRREVERPIDLEAFESAWPETAGRRIEKTRWLVQEAEGRPWEIDRFDSPELVLAEIEAADEAAAAAVELPTWLAPRIVREVTREPAFTNAEIALRLGLGRGT